ncbi:hypothetical protein [Microcoleus sp. OTE_8_concoct_300]|uniref:hypothetical protein n=1 Tax=Microcoleus sp. OTE_8_concoct_300 TaxID=2964710 RepID=UPI00403F7FB0
MAIRKTVRQKSGLGLIFSLRARFLWRRLMMGFEILEASWVCLLVVGHRPSSRSTPLRA